MEWIMNLFQWVENQLPYRCPACERWVRKVETRVVRHTSGMLVYICLDCYVDLFRVEQEGK